MFLSLSSAVLLIAAFLPLDYSPPDFLYDFFGRLGATVQFASYFLFGAASYLFRDGISYDSRFAAMAAIVLVATMFNAQTAMLCLPTLGGNLVFWFAFLPNTLRLLESTTMQSTTLPILHMGLISTLGLSRCFLVRFVPGISPITVMVVTTIGCGHIALMRWLLVEKPCLQLKQRVKERGATVTM